jgi:hypothetical protein
VTWRGALLFHPVVAGDVARVDPRVIGRLEAAGAAVASATGVGVAGYSLAFRLLGRGEDCFSFKNQD